MKKKMLVVALVMFGALYVVETQEEQGKGIPLSEFAKMGKEDTPEKAAERPFAYPPKGKSGLRQARVCPRLSLHIRVYHPREIACPSAVSP